MAEHDQKKEVRRMRALLEKMAEMAEHVEQTGSFESGIQNSVKRYNTIVEHLEDRDILPEDVFPELDEDSDSGQLGAEARLLADYLADIAEEDDEPTRGQGGKKEGKKPDLGIMVALAPFLERNELTNIVRKHFTGQSFTISDEEPAPAAAASQSPDLKTLIALAPHLDRATLGQMVRACFARQSPDDPRLLVALAPHMDKAELSQILREYMPEWFGASTSAAPSEPPAPPVPPHVPEPSASPDRPKPQETGWPEGPRPSSPSSFGER